MNETRVFSPATVSNVVCGFDCLGFALTQPCDEMVVRKIADKTIRITNDDGFGLTSDPQANVAGIALGALMDDAGIDHGFEIVSRKSIKPGSGIGSSAASASAAVVAANRLLGDRYTRSELLGFALEGESFASGAIHADNLAPCIYGGFALVRSVDPLDVVELKYPPLYATVIHPQIEIKTSEARAILPREVPLKSAVRQWSNLGSLVAGLGQGDIELIRRSLEDVIVEPARKLLIPQFDEMKSACLDAGALGGGISGSGPSVFMLSETADIARAVETALQTVYSSTGIEFNTYVSAIESNGVRFG